ncbi:MAG: hypothetical protein WCO06_06785 [Candidatus Roizmanbacteria bacterium]
MRETLSPEMVPPLLAGVTQAMLYMSFSDSHSLEDLGMMHELLHFSTLQDREKETIRFEDENRVLGMRPQDYETLAYYLDHTVAPYIGFQGSTGVITRQIIEHATCLLSDEDRITLYIEIDTAVDQRVLSDLLRKASLVEGASANWVQTVQRTIFLDYLGSMTIRRAKKIIEYGYANIPLPIPVPTIETKEESEARMTLSPRAKELVDAGILHVTDLPYSIERAEDNLVIATNVTQMMVAHLQRLQEMGITLDCEDTALVVSDRGTSGSYSNPHAAILTGINPYRINSPKKVIRHHDSLRQFMHEVLLKRQINPEVSIRLDQYFLDEALFDSVINPTTSSYRCLVINRNGKSMGDGSYREIPIEELTARAIEELIQSEIFPIALMEWGTYGFAIEELVADIVVSSLGLTIDEGEKTKPNHSKIVEDTLGTVLKEAHSQRLLFPIIFSPEFNNMIHNLDSTTKEQAGDTIRELLHKWNLRRKTPPCILDGDTANTILATLITTDDPFRELLAIRSEEYKIPFTYRTI